MALSFVGQKMTSAESIADARAPVWNALSELFLDTELQSEDHERIAKILAASPYSDQKLEAILRFEVTPVLKANLMCVAGEWAGFDEAWMREKMTPLIDQRPLFSFGVFWMVREHWKSILNRVSAHRPHERKGRSQT
jgi:hypothetical protein